MHKTPSFSPRRIDETLRQADVLDRARRASNAALGQAADRLGTPGVGGSRL